MPVVPSIRSRRCVVAAVFALLAPVPPARADRIRGDCRHDGATIRFLDGAVYRKAPFPGSDDRNDPVVVLAAFALDKVALAAAPDKSAEIGRQRRGAGEPALLELHLLRGGVVWMYREPGARFALVSRDHAGRLQARADDAEHVDLSVVLDGGGDALQCRLDVDLAYATTAPVADAPDPVGE